jgi:hypothetical protein
MTPNVTLSGTYNPDFSQVEADAWQLDINQPFALYYSERRPFFTEGADFFRTLKNAIYTRTLRDPAWGVKLAGKERGHTLAGYLVRDEITNLVFPGSQYSDGTSLNTETTATVLRYKRDVGSRHTVGVLLTGREGDDYHSRLFGIDGDFRVTAKDQIQVQVLASHTGYPREIATEFTQPDEDFAGEFFAFEYDHEARNVGWWLDLEEVDANFRADLGFIPRVDYRNAEGGVYLTRYPKQESWWTRFSSGVEFEFYEDLSDNTLLNKSAAAWLSYGGALQSWASVYAQQSRQVFEGQEFDLTGIWISGGYQPSGQVEVNLSTAFGDRIDYDNVRLGRRIRLNPEVQFQLGRHLRLYADHVFERLTVDPGRLYTANITQLTTIYQISIQAFFRAILQYVHYDRNIDNYTVDIDREFRHLFSQLLFSYKLNPRTVLFLGYSDSYHGSQAYTLTQENRTFFAKLGYAWGL